MASINIYQNIATAIVNGETKSEFDHPEIIRLILVPKQESFNKDSLHYYNRCSGVAISESIALTAGHCIFDEQQTFTPYLVRSTSFNQFEIIQSIDLKTEFEPEVIVPPVTTGPVPGCSLGIKPLFETKTLDITLLKFPKGTFKKFISLDTSYLYQLNATVELFGFGSKSNSFEAPLPMSPIRTEDLGYTQSKIMREGLNRLAIISSNLSGFADRGDSGGPIIANQKVIGILNTIEEKCETELGEDYAILNSFTFLSRPRVKDWIQKNLELLK